MDYPVHRMVKDDFQSPLPPLEASASEHRPAPAWVALLAAWGGLVTLVSAGIVPFLPGSRDPRAELERLAPYSPADRVIPVPLYACAATLCLGIIVLWRMRKAARPLSDALAAQRVQAWVGIALGSIGATVIYLFVALRGPG